MKKRISALLLALSVISLTGCYSDDTDDSSTTIENSSTAVTDISGTDTCSDINTAAGTETSNKTEVCTDTNSDTGCNADTNTSQKETNSAVISIQTVNQSEDALNFILEPISKVVCEQIASWYPDEEIEFPPAPYYEDCIINVKDKNGNVTLADVEGKVKVRGNWTSLYMKKPLKIKFDKKQSMLGLNDNAKMKNWILLAEYKDASMLRNKAAFSLAKEIYSAEGLYTPDSEFAEVEVNGEYQGLYLLTEMQQINPNRVNITETPKDYTGTDIGYLLEMDGYFISEPELQSFHVDYADNAPLVPYDGKGGSGRTIQCLPNSESDETGDIGFTITNTLNSQEQHDFIANFTNCVYRIMYEAAYNNKAYCFNEDYSQIAETKDISPEEAVNRVVDVKSLADTYILNEIVCNADIYWSSFYMDVDFGKDGNKKLTFEAPWDFDSALGNKDRCLDGTGFYAANIVPDVNGGTAGGGAYDTINPWLAVLANTDWFQETVRTKWTELYDSGAFSKVTKSLEKDSDDYKAAFEKNYSKWNNIINNEEFANELSSEAAKCKTEKEAADFLVKWINSRIDFLNSEWHK